MVQILKKLNNIECIGEIIDNDDKYNVTTLSDLKMIQFTGELGFVFGKVLNILS